MKKIIVTGANSGLGKSLWEALQQSPTETEVRALTRSNRRSEIDRAKSLGGVDTIIHAAFGGQGGYEQFDIEDHYKYVDDNILLTKELLDIPHKRFIYISSLVVYETEHNNYKTTKLYCESMVQKLSSNHLILRCPAILNKHMRKNNLIKILDDDTPTLSLTADSTFNYVSDVDITNFIEDPNWYGVVDFVSSKNIELGEIQDMIGKQVHFGKYKFTTPEIKSSYLKESSKQVLQQFIETRK